MSTRKMTKHTPGPWREFQDDAGHDILAPDGSHIASVEPVNSLDPEAEQSANAALLAAAPNLLAALHAALVYLGDDTADDSAEAIDTRAVIRAAIAKVEG